MDNADSRYDVTKSWNLIPNEYNAPSGSWEDAAIRQATAVITMDRKSVQALVRPPIRSILPPGTVLRPNTPSIEDVIQVPRTYEDQRSYYSGGPAGYTGSAQNGWGGAV